MSKYYPYFRGKQFELIAIRENADLLAAAEFVPIIEPVKENLKGLQRALEAIAENQGQAVVIVNPQYGQISNDETSIAQLLDKNFIDNSKISAGILLKNEMSSEQINDLLKRFEEHTPTLIHAGFSDAQQLIQTVGERVFDLVHCFIDGKSGKLYQQHFTNSHTVLVRDGFQKRSNKDHPKVEQFSDLHITYPMEGVKAFGDYLIVGDDYSESGGPVYTTAIHLTFIDTDKQNVMYIYHFLSTRTETPKDPAGKFLESLEKLLHDLDSGQSKILETRAIGEFRELYKRGHFPGLGYVKKLSMQHHLETLADFLKE